MVWSSRTSSRSRPSCSLAPPSSRDTSRSAARSRSSSARRRPARGSRDEDRSNTEEDQPEEDRIEESRFEEGDSAEGSGTDTQEPGHLWREVPPLVARTQAARLEDCRDVLVSH